MEEILHQLMCSLSHYLQGLCIPGGAGFLPSTVSSQKTGLSYFWKRRSIFTCTLHQVVWFELRNWEIELIEWYHTKTAHAKQNAYGPIMYRYCWWFRNPIPNHCLDVTKICTVNSGINYQAFWTINSMRPYTSNQFFDGCLVKQPFFM